MDSKTASLAAAIGLKVKAERAARQWTLDQLALSAGVSRRSVVNVEQGVANPSVGTLLRLSGALGIGLPSLVEPPTTQAVNVTRNGNGAALWSSDAGGSGVLVAGSASPDVFELWEWFLAPGDCHRSQAHADGTREAIHVLNGMLMLDVDGQEFTLAAGDAATFAGDAPHSYANTGQVPTRFSLAIIEPGSRGNDRRPA